LVVARFWVKTKESKRRVGEKGGTKPRYIESVPKGRPLTTVRKYRNIATAMERGEKSSREGKGEEVH